MAVPLGRTVLDWAIRSAAVPVSTERILPSTVAVGSTATWHLLLSVLAAGSVAVAGATLDVLLALPTGRAGT